MRFLHMPVGMTNNINLNGPISYFMNYFKKILRFAKPYTKYVWLNILFNILYAIFNVLSVL
ncbi:MAG: hypothetical protein J7K34_08675, partial [Flavobacteriaceae bacterium]|nr:hypothetical protein [Flavobacteriaceae bacterium]